ncbi:MAG: hypothetical protein H6Q99_289 [Proteobacteria bacterium]|nr:hypothetical protein [Pseudomonadota bacterium]
MLIVAIAIATTVYAAPVRYFPQCYEPKEPTCIYPRFGKSDNWFASCKIEMLDYADELNKYVECERKRALDIYKDAAERFMCQAEGKSMCLW